MEQFSQMIADALKLPVHRVENTLKLLQGGATIPFISRYRKEESTRVSGHCAPQGLQRSLCASCCPNSK